MSQDIFLQGILSWETLGIYAPPKWDGKLRERKRWVIENMSYRKHEFVHRRQAEGILADSEIRPHIEGK